MLEKQAIPPSLLLGRKLHLGNKADLLGCLGLEEMQFTCAPDLDATFVHGAAVVQMFSTGTAQTFQEYSDLCFFPMSPIT